MNTILPVFDDDTYLLAETALHRGLIVMADPQLAREVGFRVRVAYSRACFQRHVEWVSRAGCQDASGRAWDVLMLSAIALRTTANACGVASTDIHSVPPGGDEPARGALHVAWLGDERDEPIVLVMLAHERVRPLNRASRRQTVGKE